MRRRLLVAAFTLMAAMILALPAQAQQKPKPFTQEQVQGVVRSGPGSRSGAKLIRQRGIDFAPGEGFLPSLKAAGAHDAPLAARRAAKHTQWTSDRVECVLSVGPEFRMRPFEHGESLLVKSDEEWNWPNVHEYCGERRGKGAMLRVTDRPRASACG